MLCNCTTDARRCSSAAGAEAVGAGPQAPAATETATEAAAEPRAVPKGARMAQLPPAGIVGRAARAEGRRVMGANGRQRFLAKLLGAAADVSALHEPKSIEAAMIGDQLRVCNDLPMNSSAAARAAVKIAAVEEHIKSRPCRLYAETNHMFIKTFYDVVVAREEWDVDVVVLRRSLPLVVRSHLMQLHGYEFLSDLVAEMYINTTWSVNAAHRPPVLWPQSHADRILRYVTDIEARTQRLVSQYESSPRVRFTEVWLEDIVLKDRAEALLRSLDLELADPLASVLEKNVNKKKFWGCATPIGAAEAKELILSYIVRLPHGHLIQMPSLRSRETFRDRPPLIVGATLAWSPVVCSSNGLLQRHLAELMAHCQAIVVGADLASCPAAAAAIEAASAVHVSVNAAEGLPAALSRMLAAADELGATHVVTLNAMERLSSDFREESVFQQMVLSLAPGESLHVETTERVGYHVPVAFAMSASALPTTDYVRAAFGASVAEDTHKYYIEPGTGLPGYPHYRVERVQSAE
eukprot:m51a1_g477 hypothetical protein (523) ;mRNA; r:199887-201727